MWGIRVVVPAKFHDKVLTELHQNHPGICRMKSIGGSYVWWPNFDNDIKKLVKSCGACLSVKPSPPKTPLNPDYGPQNLGQEYILIIWVPFLENLTLSLSMLTPNGLKYLKCLPLLNLKPLMSYANICCSWITRSFGLGQWTTVHSC